jgi:hypothetical protein
MKEKPPLLPAMHGQGAGFSRRSFIWSGEGGTRIQGQIGLIGENAVDSRAHERRKEGQPVAVRRGRCADTARGGKKTVLGSQSPRKNVEPGGVSPVDQI